MSEPVSVSDEDRWARLPVGVYGTLREGERLNPLMKHFVGLRTVTLHGWTLRAGASSPFPYAVFSGDPGDSITVEVYGCDHLNQGEFEGSILALDLIEGAGYTPHIADMLYERVLVEVMIEDSSTRRMWLYAASPGTQGYVTATHLPVLPGGDWKHRFERT